MKLSRERLLREAGATGFRPESLEKVIRLVSLLNGIFRHADLRERLVLKGGTALNLFLFEVPRLSVDIDLTYLLDYILTDLRQQYNKAAEALDFCMETFPYSDGTEAEKLLHTYERSADIDDDGLHYKFELRVFVEKPVDIRQKCRPARLSLTLP